MRKAISQEMNQLTSKLDTINGIKNQYEDALMWLEEAKEGTESWDVLLMKLVALEKRSVPLKLKYY